MSGGVGRSLPRRRFGAASRKEEGKKKTFLFVFTETCVTFKSDLSASPSTDLMVESRRVIDGGSDGR